MYNMLYDMMKNGDLSGSQYLDILLNNLVHETGEDVIADNLQSNVPATINKMIPLEYYEANVFSFYSQLYLVCLSV